MEYKEAVGHTKNKKGMKQSVSGLFSKSAEVLNRTALKPTQCEFGEGYGFVLTEMSGHFDQARKAWLEGDLETVAEFFGLYV